MDLKETYNQIAENWHHDHQEDDWWIEGTNAFVSFLEKGDSVLDVGCGAGTKSRYLTEKGLGVTGIDFSENMVEIAKREVPSCRFMVCDLKDADRLSESFGGIFMQAVLLHIPKSEALEVLKKLSTRLKEGGYFYIAVKERREGGPEEEIKQERDYGYTYERFFSYYTLEEVESYPLKLGMEIVFSDVRPSGKTNWIQVIAKKYGNN